VHELRCRRILGQQDEPALRTVQQVRRNGPLYHAKSVHESERRCLLDLPHRHLREYDR